MRHAIQSNGTAVVVKLLHDSHELKILRDLQRIDSPINHVIPLLGMLKVNTWTFFLLPEATLLDDRFALGMIHDNVKDFSQQLIEGVAFLHSQGIAHLDIKPQNIVVLRNQLFIVDFDISVRVDGPSALIDRWCGTPGWMAPEIGHRDGPKCWYSPIRADLWSCGLVLQYLAREGDVEEEPVRGTNPGAVEQNAAASSPVTSASLAEELIHSRAFVERTAIYNETKTGYPFS